MKLDGKYKENFLNIVKAKGKENPCLLQSISLSNYDLYMSISSVIDKISEENKYMLYLNANNKCNFEEICKILKEIFTDYTLIKSINKEGYNRACILIKDNVKFNEDFCVHFEEDFSDTLLFKAETDSFIAVSNRSVNIPYDYFIKEKINEKNPILFREYTKFISESKIIAERNFKFYSNLYEQISDEDKLYMEVSE